MEISFVVVPARESSRKAASNALLTSSERASKNSSRGIPKQNFLASDRKAESFGMFGSWPTREYRIPVRVATSPAVRASGPAQSRAGDSGTMPRQEMRPQVGFNPKMPQSDAGIRMEPPVSVPMLPQQRPAATASAEPPLDPPATRARSQGFRTGP